MNLTLKMCNLYEQEGFSDGEVLDLQGISGTNCYCSDEAFGTIDSLVAGALEGSLFGLAGKGLDAEAEGCGIASGGVRWIDSGDYHYLSLFFMRQIREPFELLLIDNHPDDQTGAFDEGILSCGNWVREARRLPLLKADAWIDGDCRVHRRGGNAVPTDAREAEGKLTVCDESGSCCAADGKLTVCDESGSCCVADGKLTACNESGSCCVADGKLTACNESGSCCAADGELMLGDSKLPIYVSLDLDVLDREYFRTDWSQGSMTPEQLEGILRRLSGRKILGIDICGGLTVEKGATPSDLRTNLLLRHRLADFLSAI